MRVTRAVSALVVMSMAAAVPAVAQSSRPFSVQLSPIYVKLLGDDFEGAKSAIGFEGQLRYTKGSLSFGAGVEVTKHGIEDENGNTVEGYGLRRVGLFFEPRYVIPTSSEHIAPYISARVSLVTVKLTVPENSNIITGKATGTTLNAGGGILMRLASRINLDIGATVGHTTFGTVKFDDGSEGAELGKGMNVIARVGLSIGF